MIRPLVLALAIVGCSPATDAPEAEAQVKAEASAAVTTTASANASRSSAAKATEFVDNQTRDGGKRIFKYSWPAEVSAIPVLAERLTEERTAQLAGQKKVFSEMGEGCPPDAVSCRSNAFEKEWKVVADTPRLLSLSAQIYTFTGGAHGNTGFDAMVWDREGGRGYRALDLFESDDAFSTMMGEPFCDALNAERENRRGAPVPSDGEWPNDCPSIAETTVIVGSANGKTFDRLGFLIDPYTAGPYAEGAYDITLPVTPAVVGIVKPAFRASFSARN